MRIGNASLSLRVSTPLLTILTLLLVTLPAQARSGDPASDRWPPLPAEAQAFHHGGLRDSVISGVASEPELYGFDAPVTEISFGQLYPVFLYTREFVSGRTSGERAAAFKEGGDWITPVIQHGTIRNVVSVANPTGTKWEFGTLGYGADLGRRLSEVRRGDLVVIEPPLNAWFRVHGRNISPLNSQADRVLSGQTTISAFQSQLAARYADSDIDPDGVMVGGGAKIPAPMDRMLPSFAAGVGIVVLGATLLARRRRRHEAT